MDIKGSSETILHRLDNKPVEERRWRIAFLDEKGLLFGKMNLVDLVLALFFLLLFGSILIFGTRMMGYQQLAVYAIQPLRVRVGTDRFLTITGTGFSQACTVQMEQLTLPLRAIFVNEARLDVEIPSDVPPGQKTLFVRNNRGRLVFDGNHAFEAIWVPQVTHIEPRVVYEGERLNIFGQYFVSGCKVFVEGIEVPTVVYMDSGHLQVRLSGMQRFPLGVCSLAVENPKEGRVVLENAIEPLLRPVITRVYPTSILASDTTDLVIEGVNLREGLLVKVGDRLLKQVRSMSPTRLEGVFSPKGMEEGWQGLSLTIPDGPTVVSKQAVYVTSTVPVPVVVSLLLKKESCQKLKDLKLPQLRQLPGRNFNLWMDVAEGKVETVLSGGMKKVGDRYGFFYKGYPLTVGTTVSFSVSGERIDGVVDSPPVAVLPEDEL